MSTKLKGIPPFRGDDAQRMLVRTSEHEEINVTSANAAPTTILNCRELYCDADSGGLGTAVVKVDYLTDDGQSKTEVLTLIPGVPRNIANVTNVYRYYTGTTGTTAQYYNSSGTLVSGVKLRR